MTSLGHETRQTSRPGATPPPNSSDAPEINRPIKINEWGFTLFTPDGECTRFEGLLHDDETFDSSIFGLLNISEAWRCMPKGGCPAVIPIDERLRSNISRIEYDAGHLDSISIQRRGEPILLAPGPDGWHVVDGIHRLQRRIADGLPTVKCHHLAPEMIKHIRVRRFTWVRNKAWMASDSVREAKFKQLMRGAKAFVQSAKRS